MLLVNYLLIKIKKNNMGFLNIFKKIGDYLFNPKNRSALQFIIIGALVLIILMQRSCNSSLRDKLELQERETQRIQNNYDAEKDIVKQYKINDSTYRAERLAFEITLKELTTKYADLTKGFEDFKKMPPKVIIKQPLLVKETIREVPVTANVDSSGNGTFNFLAEANYPDNNYRKLSGNIPFTSKFFNKLDSSVVSYENLPYRYVLNPGTGTFELEQNINLKVGLFQDPKTNKIKVAVNTSYPGITFTGLEAYDIMNEDLIKSQIGSKQKVWGLGLNFGYGASLNMGTNQVFFGPQFGIGLHYTPTWLQWGK